MYRRAASQGPLQGVAAGPYTGGRKVVDAGKLSRAAKQRLVDCLAGRAEPSPIAYDRPSSFASSVRAVWGAVLAVVVLVVTFARGFDDATSNWEVQPLHVVAIYLISCGLFSFALLAILRRRFLLGGEALRPGRYLLPLDIVEIAPLDARGRQRITVQPLGDARDAMIRGEGRKGELVIVFADTAQVTFPLRGDAEGQVMLRRLEHAQRLLEELTYTKELAQAFAHDPFFDLRADGSWSSAAAGDEDAPPSLRTKRSFIAGRAGPALAGALALVLAFGTFGIRNGLARRLIVARELKAERERVARELAAKRAKEAEEEDKAREAAAKAFGAPPQRTPAQCLEKLRENAAPKHPEVTKIVEAMIEQVKTDQNPQVPVVFTRKDDEGIVTGASWEEHEKKTVAAFARVLSETCPANVVRFVHDAGVTIPRPRWGLFVDYTVTTPKKVTVRRRGVLGESLSVALLNVVFDVRLAGPKSSGKSEFRLTMPPPEKLSMAHRPQSIFPSSLEDDGTYDERVYESMTARAFDRLYDEIWSLFFAGNPRVPLDLSPTSTHTGTDP